jgi:hypothetical protein
MLRRLFTPTTIALLSAGLLVSTLSAESNNATAAVAQPGTSGVRIEALDPFTHSALIPAGADPGSIRFERVKTVKLPTQVAYTSDAGYCREAVSREASGSAFCPQVSAQAFVMAYAVTYSYNGPVLASDEYPAGKSTFTVYFRPEEVAPRAQGALSAGKASRADGASLFAVSTYRDTARRVAIDDRQSHFCPGNYVDGQWIHTDAACRDRVNYTTALEPSAYVTVNVVSARNRIGVTSTK